MNAMPVRMPVAEQDSVGPYNRMSASQANTYEACLAFGFTRRSTDSKCPKSPFCSLDVPWKKPCVACSENLPVSWHRRVRRHWKHPLTRMTERQYRPPNAHGCKGLMPLFPNERPQSLDDLEAWALQRGHHHLPPALERMRMLWENDERRSGDWAEVDQERCLEMVLNALRFHLGEVERCRQAGGGPGLIGGEEVSVGHGLRPTGSLTNRFRDRIRLPAMETCRGRKHGRLHDLGLSTMLQRLR